MSIHEKLKQVDDGSFDELKKKIEQQTEDEAERERLLTETVLFNFMRTCSLNGKKNRENSRASAEPEVPEKLKSYMKTMQASEAVFVIQKRLTNSDLSDSQCRLSIPEGKIDADRFLASQEKEKLCKCRALPVTLVEIDADPVVETNLRLKKWHTNYVLTEKWNEVRRRNEEKFHGADGVHAVMQLWSFRHDSRLYFALNEAKEEAKVGGASTNGSNGSDGASTAGSNGDGQSSSLKSEH